MGKVNVDRLLFRATHVAEYAGCSAITKCLNVNFIFNQEGTMNLRISVLLVITALALSGCLQNSTAMRAVEGANRDLAASGSPYRMKAKEFAGGGIVMTQELIGTPSTTLADGQLIIDVLKSISEVEKKIDPSAEPEVVEIRRVSVKTNKVVEVWVISRDNKRIPYLIHLVPNPQGGVDINVNGPWASLLKPS